MLLISFQIVSFSMKNLPAAPRKIRYYGKPDWDKLIRVISMAQNKFLPEHASQL
jgi:hypothetical protein